MSEIEAQLADTMDVSDGRATRAPRRDRAGTCSSSIPNQFVRKVEANDGGGFAITEHQSIAAGRQHEYIIGAQLLVVLTLSWYTPPLAGDGHYGTVPEDKRFT